MQNFKLSISRNFCVCFSSNFNFSLDIYIKNVDMHSLVAVALKWARAYSRPKPHPRSYLWMFLGKIYCSTTIVPVNFKFWLLHLVTQSIQFPKKSKVYLKDGSSTYQKNHVKINWNNWNHPFTLRKSIFWNSTLKSSAG